MERHKQIEDLVDKTMGLLERPSTRSAPAGFAARVVTGLNSTRHRSFASYWQVAAMLAFIAVNAFSFSAIQEDSEIDTSTSVETFINQYNLEGPTYTW